MALIDKDTNSVHRECPTLQNLSILVNLKSCGNGAGTGVTSVSRYLSKDEGN